MLNYIARCFTRLRYNIYTNYFAICIFNVLCFALITGVSSFFLYKSYFKNLDQNLKRNAATIEQGLGETLSDIERLALYAGKGIINADTDLEKIFHLLNGIGNAKYRIKESITVFEWSNHENQCILNSEVGLLKEPIDVTNRSYVRLCREKPWVVHLGPPVYGITTQLWIIPGGIGITDAKGKYKGMITFGINIYHLTEKLSADLPASTRFLLLDQHQNPVLRSQSIQEKKHHDAFLNLKEIRLPANVENGEIDPIIKDKNISYVHFRNLHPYPYTLLVGYDDDFIENDLIATIIPKILHIFLYCLVCILLLYYFHKSVIRISQRANKAHREYLKIIRQDIQETIDKIANHSSSLMSLEKLDCKKNTLVKEIYQLSSKLKSSNFHTPHFQPININTLIQDCIFIYSQSALTDKKQIEFLPVDPPLELKVDALGFKRMILGLISLSLKSIYQRGNLIITAHKNSNEHLVITFKDTGFALTFYEIQKLSKRFGEWASSPLIGTDIEISDIIEIVEHHRGSITENTFDKAGKTIVLTFPLCQSFVSKTTSSVTHKAKILLFKPPSV